MKRTIAITEKEANTLSMAILTRREFAKKMKGDALADDRATGTSSARARSDLTRPLDGAVVRSDAGREKFIRIYDEEIQRLDDLLARVRGEAL